jgi:hypothetical protein
MTRVFKQRIPLSSGDMYRFGHGRHFTMSDRSMLSGLGTENGTWGPLAWIVAGFAGFFLLNTLFGGGYQRRKRI